MLTHTGTQTIETERLILRRLAIEDTENIDYEQIAKVKAEIIVCEEKQKELSVLAEDNAVTQDDIAHVIELWTGIPSSKVIESDLRKLSDMEKHLREKIIGQDEAIDLVCAAVRRGRVQLSPRRRPSSFIFPTKTASSLIF